MSCNIQREGGSQPAKRTAFRVSWCAVSASSWKRDLRKKGYMILRVIARLAMTSFDPLQFCLYRFGFHAFRVDVIGSNGKVIGIDQFNFRAPAPIGTAVEIGIIA